MATFKVTVVIEGVKTPFDKFEDAARFWDRETWQRPAPAGGIEVQEFQNGVCVRDGWLLHVDSGGSVYVNPNWV